MPRRRDTQNLTLFGRWIDAMLILIGISTDELAARAEMDSTSLLKIMRGANSGSVVSPRIVRAMMALAREHHAVIDEALIEEALLNAAGHASARQRTQSENYLTILQERTNILRHVEELNEHITKLEEIIKDQHQQGVVKDEKIAYLTEQRDVLMSLDRRRRSPQEPTEESTTST